MFIINTTIMSHQTNLFNFEEPPIKEELSIVVKNKSKQSAINEINKKIQKIEKLKTKFEKEKAQLAKIKKAYDKDILPFEKEFFDIKKRVIDQLYKHYTSKGFAKWQTALLEDFLMEACEFLFDSGMGTSELIEIYEAVKKNISEKMDPMEKEFVNEMAKDILSDFGFDVEDDDENFDFEDFINDKDFAKKHHEQQHEYQKIHEESLKKEKVLNTNKKFQKLYKSLVKKAHPDLVTSTKEKEQREVLMKKLSEAWQNRDYYQLLLLKNKIEKDNDTTTIEIDDEQSKSLLKQLDAEIEQLDFTIFQFKEDEEHQFYFKNFKHTNQNGLKQKIFKYNEFLKLQKKETLLELDRLKTKAATKQYLKDKRDEFDNYDEDFFFPLSFK